MFRKTLKRWLDLFGIEIRRRPSIKEIEEKEIQKLREENRWIIHLKLNTIIDIGANEGQFAHKMRKLLPVVQIISFEPIPEVYNILVNSFHNDSLFSSFNIGLGESVKTTKMWLNEYSPSSSLLKMKEHLNQFSFAKQQIAIDVKIDTLDRVLNLSMIRKPYLVKIDVQGYEENVLKGGRKVISSAEVVIIEVSYRQLYEDHMLFDGIYRQMQKMGFYFHGNYEQLLSPLNNEVLQADAIFLKY